MLGGRSSLRAQITKMNPYQCFIIIEVQIQDLLLLPVFQCTDHILFRVVELVRNSGHTDSLFRIQHAQQIEIDLQLCVVGIFHIFINKQIGYYRRICIIIFIERYPCHNTQYLLSQIVPFSK